MEDLGEVLRRLSPSVAGRADVLVGLDDGDDAAVLEVTESLALVLTLDFFTPIVDDAYTWGRIACANAASDVYAMGGTPLVGLNIVGWPSGSLPLDLLADVLLGGADTAAEAGMVIVGGHTVDDPEPKYGLCVVGRVERGAMMTVAGARPGDALVLTKRIGTGVIATAIKEGVAPEPAVEAAVASMTRLNAGASRVLAGAGVRGCTDVTGYGLLGHLHRMVRASGAGAEVESAAVPLLPGARDLAEGGYVPGGTKRNRDALEAVLDWGADVDETTRTLLCDAQTSGGLLAACPPDALDGVLANLDGETAVIGTVTAAEAGRIVIA
jgi:selenide,water dikinase